MVMISPVKATMKPAPAETFRLRTCTGKAHGGTQELWSSEAVLGLGHADGQVPKTQLLQLFICFRAPAVSSHFIAMINFL